MASATPVVVASAALLVLAACTTPPAATPTTTSTAPKPPSVTFDPAIWRTLLARHAANGWLYIVSAAIPPDRAKPEFTVETHFLLNPNTIVRHESTARLHMLSIQAQPTGEVHATRVVTDYHCPARTWQLRAIENYRNAEATERLSGGPVTNPPVNPIVARSPGVTMFDMVCTGTLARSGTRSTAPLPASVAVSGKAVRATQATGIVVAPRRVLTNAHAVAGCTTVDVTLDGKHHEGRVYKRDVANDLALLDVATLEGTTFPALRTSAALGETVVAAGYPSSAALGSGLTVTSGLINSLSGAGDLDSRLQMSAPVQPGNSGGPLLDAGGSVVGVVAARLDELVSQALGGAPSKDVGYAIKPEVVTTFLRAENVQPRRADAPGQLGTAEVAARARAFTARLNCTLS